MLPTAKSSNSVHASFDYSNNTTTIVRNGEFQTNKLNKSTYIVILQHWIDMSYIQVNAIESLYVSIQNIL